MVPSGLFLRENSYNIKITSFKVTVQRHLARSHYRTDITSVWSPKVNPAPISRHSPPLSQLAPQNPLPAAAELLSERFTATESHTCSWGLAASAEPGVLRSGRLAAWRGNLCLAGPPAGAVGGRCGEPGPRLVSDLPSRRPGTFCSAARPGPRLPAPEGLGCRPFCHRYKTPQQPSHPEAWAPSPCGT